MKKQIASFVLGLFIAIGSTAQNHDGHNHAPQTPAAPKTEDIKFSETVFDFGKIPQGKPVTHVFTVENIGNDSLKIDNVQASCGCTTPEWTKTPIAKGGKTTIKVGYNSAAEGFFDKTITVYYNGGQVKVLNIKGIVWKTPDQSAPTNQALNIFQ